MITAEKVDIFKYYKGYYDGYYIQNKNKNRVISDDEWYYLDNLIQDIYLMRKKIVTYETEIRKKIRLNCDSDETCNLIFELEKYLNEQKP